MVSCYRRLTRTTATRKSGDGDCRQGEDARPQGGVVTHRGFDPPAFRRRGAHLSSIARAISRRSPGCVRPSERLRASRDTGRAKLGGGGRWCGDCASWPRLRLAQFLAMLQHSPRRTRAHGWPSGRARPMSPQPATERWPRPPRKREAVPILSALPPIV